MPRKELLKAKNTLLPKDLELSHIEKGEVKIPELIGIFFQNLTEECMLRQSRILSRIVSNQRFRHQICSQTVTKHEKSLRNRN